MQINCDKKVNFTPNDFYESKELYLEGAQKIISVQAFARTSGVEVVGGEVRVGYALTIRALYLEEDGNVSKREESYDLNSSFRAGVSPSDFVFVKTTAIGVEYSGTQNLEIRVMLEQKGFYLRKSSFEPCSMDGVFYKNKKVDSRCCAPIKQVEFVIDKTEIVQENLGEVLCADASIVPKMVSTATDICQIEGTASVYVTSVYGGELKWTCLNFPFNYELLAEGVSAEDEAVLYLTPFMTSLSVTALENGVEIGVQIATEVKGYYERISSVEYPIDAYSKACELGLDMGNAVISERGCRICSLERLHTTLPLENLNDVVEVVSLGMPWVGASNVSAKPTLNVDGVICLEAIVKRDSGERERVFLEIPYSFNLKEQTDCSENVDVDIQITSFGARARFGSSLEISLEALVTVSGDDEKVITYLCGAENRGEKAKNDAVISVYLVGEGETLFDCAKALGSDEEELLALNPELDLPLKVGDKVLLYRPL